MRVEEARTQLAAQKRPGHCCLGVAEGMLVVDLLPYGSPTPLAVELPVEALEGLGLGCENVFVTLDRLPGDFWVHLLEEWHGSNRTPIQREQ